MEQFSHPSQIPILKGSPPNIRLVKILTDISLCNSVSSGELEEVLLLSQSPENLPPFGAWALASACIDLLPRPGVEPRPVSVCDYRRTFFLNKFSKLDDC